MENKEQISQSENTLTQSSALNSLSSSVNSLRTSLSLLDSSISILASGTADFPRIKTILSSTRHFELTPSSTLSAAQKSLAAEIQPALMTLLSRAETYIARLERKQESLLARSELLENRLDGAKASKTNKDSYNRTHLAKPRTESCKGIWSKNENEDKVNRLKALRLKKEKLGYTLERLVLQSQQRQRQLRHSVAAS